MKIKIKIKLEIQKIKKIIMDKRKNIENENRNYEESRIYDKTNINNKNR